MPVIDVQHVQKRFRIPDIQRSTVREHLFGILRRRQFVDLEVLRDISFSVERGECIGIMGRNGSGKSTLLKILAGIYQPDGGTVSVQAPVTPILNLGLGWNGELTARDNLELTGTAMGLSLAEIRGQFDEIIGFAELERFVDVPLKFYSSGMSSRLAYAIAFRAVRDILLLDEVFAVGDASFVKRCQERFVELHRQGHTLILVGHGAETIRTFCDHAILIEGGYVHTQGDANTVADEYLRIVRDSGGPADDAA